MKQALPCFQEDGVVVGFGSCQALTVHLSCTHSLRVIVGNQTCLLPLRNCSHIVLCPLHALPICTDRTVLFCDELFVSWAEPHVSNQATKQCVSHWVVGVTADC